MPDGVALPPSGVTAASESFDTATRQPGNQRQEILRAIAGAISITGYDAITAVAEWNAKRAKAKATP